MPTVSITTVGTYPQALQAELVLGFSQGVPGPGDDPTVVFITGSRQEIITIAAGQTVARFSGGATSIPVQTGTTAGTITLAVRYVQASGRVLTVGTVTSASTAVAKAVPGLVQLFPPQLNCGTQPNTATTQFVLTGFSNTRELSAAQIRLRYGTGEIFSANVPLSAVSAAWYQTAAAVPNGGAFTLTVPATLQGELACASFEWTASLVNSIGGSTPAF